MTSITETTNINEEALKDTLPLLREDREWGFFDFVWVQSGLSIATWAFLFGGITALFVGFWDGLWTMMVGNCIGVIFMVLASVLMTCKWGTEQFILQRSIYGAMGIMVLVLGLLTVTELGWTTILAIMFGRASTQVLNHVAGTEYSASSPVVLGIAMIALLIGWWVVVKGDRAVRLMNRIIAPGLIIMSVLLLVTIFVQKSFAEIASTGAIDPFDSRAMNLMIAIELNIAAGVSWWTVAGNIARGAKTQRSAVWGSFVGLVPVAVVAQMVGLTAALVMGSSDPTEWMLPIVGPFIGIILLVFIGLANLTSMSSIVYATCQAFAQHLGEKVQRLGWARMSGIFFAICAVLLFLTSTALYDQFFKFVAWTQAVLVSAIGITIADYHLLRKRKIDLAELYNLDAGSAYHFWGRVNYVALASLAIGFAIFVSLLDPFSLVGGGTFTVTSASLPTLFGAMIAHYLLTRIFVIPRGKGGY